MKKLYLYILQSPYATPQQKQLTLEMICSLTEKSDCILEMFQLYDCSLSSPSVIKTLLKILVDIVFEIDPCYVKADKNLIRSVMSNLLENAVKFTNQKGNIRITQKIYQHEVFVSVYNTGCGIAEEDKPFVFERFYKADKSRSVNRQGTGIGLYLVKDVLSRHGKTITLLSEEGKYAEFTFSLEQGKEL